MMVEKVETDVLCVGGGIAGLMAAIRAANLGSRVVIAEKGATRYSGSGRSGNDHFWCYLPEVHGSDLESFIDECMITQLGTMTASLGRTVVRTWLGRSREMALLWESWGIPMRRDGSWYLAGHSFPGRVMTHVKYQGKDQKPLLMEQALRAGVSIMDRTMVFEVCAGAEGVTGALAIDTREDRLIEFRAPAVILGTGMVVRLFPGVTPAVMGNNMRPFTSTGDGRAMAYRAGAELVNVEFFSRHVGVKNYCRSGQSTWTGVCRDPEGKPIGKYLAEPDPRYGDIIMEVDKQIFERYRQAGRGPVYMDCRGLAEGDHLALEGALIDEGNRGSSSTSKRRESTQPGTPSSSRPTSCATSASSRRTRGRRARSGASILQGTNRPSASRGRRSSDGSPGSRHPASPGAGPAALPGRMALPWMRAGSSSKRCRGEPRATTGGTRIWPSSTPWRTTAARCARRPCSGRASPT